MKKRWGDPKALPHLFIGKFRPFWTVCFLCKKEISLRSKLSATFVLLILLLSFNIQGFDQIWHMGQRPVGFYFRNSWIANAFMLVLASESLMKWKNSFRFNEFLVALIGFGSIFIVHQCLLHFLM